MDYYSEVFVDSEPFKSILKHPLNCIDFNKIESIPLSARLHSIINLHDSEDFEENEEILDRINGFHNITLVAIKQAFSVFPRRYAEHKTDGRQAGVGKELEVSETMVNSNLDKVSHLLPFLLDYQSSVLMLLNMQLILGLADSSLIKAAIECAGLVLKTNCEKIQSIEKSSLLCFFKYCRRKSSVKNSFQKLITQSLNLLETLAVVRHHYQMISLLKLWVISEKTKSSQSEEVQTIVNEIFSIFSLSAKGPKGADSITLTSMNKTFVSIIDNIFPEENSPKKEMVPSEDSGFMGESSDEKKKLRTELKSILNQRMPVDLILIENLFIGTAQNDSHNFKPSYNVRQDSDSIQETSFLTDFTKRVCSMVMSTLDQHQQVYSLLTKLVVFQGPSQRKIYRLLNFEPSPTKEHFEEEEKESVPESEKDLNIRVASSPTSLPKLETEATDYRMISIHYIEKLFTNLKRRKAIGDPSDPGSRLQIEQASAEVLRAVTALTAYLQDSYNLKLQLNKTQNLMRNLGFGRLILAISKEGENKELLASCLKFFHYFSYMNAANLSSLEPYFSNILRLTLDLGFGEMMIASLINNLEDPQAASSRLKWIFNMVMSEMGHEGVADYLHIGREKHALATSKIAITASRLGHLVTYLKILSYSAVDSYVKPKKDHQGLLLSLLINNPEIARIYESQFFFSARKFMQSKPGSLMTEADLKFLEFYFEALSLIADLGRYHPESKEQARRIVERAILQEYLFSKNQFFLLKREVLKLYHYVGQIYQIFLEKETQIDSELLKQLLRDLVCPDLSKSSRYLYALVAHGALL